MSYLMKFERRADRMRGYAPTPQKPNPVFHVQWRSIAGLVEVNTRTPQNVTVFYRQYSRLGNLLKANNEQECYFVGQAIRKALDLPPGTTFSYMAA